MNLSDFPASFLRHTEFGLSDEGGGANQPADFLSKFPTDGLSPVDRYKLCVLGYGVAPTDLVPLVPNGVLRLSLKNPDAGAAPEFLGPVLIRAYDAETGLTVLKTIRGDCWCIWHLIMVGPPPAADSRYCLYALEGRCLLSPEPIGIRRAHERFAE